MSYKALNNLQAVNLDSLDTPSATKEYPLGTRIGVNDTTKGGESVFMYIKAHEALSLGQPIQVVEGSGGDAEVVTASIATLGDGQGALIAFPTTAVTSAYYFWGQISGVITAAAGTVAAGDHVEVLNGGTTVVVDGTSGSTTRSVRSIGIAKTATASGTASIVVMPGRRVHIAGSS
jgi:hypothetical protein